MYHLWVPPQARQALRFMPRALHTPLSTKGQEQESLTVFRPTLATQSLTGWALELPKLSRNAYKQQSTEESHMPDHPFIVPRWFSHLLAALSIRKVRPP